MKRCRWTLVLIAMFAATARGGEVTITGSGTWDDTAMTTPYSAPNTSWSFSVTVPNPLDANPTTMLSGAEYTLGGSPAGATMTSINFYSAGQGGGLDLNFSDLNTVSLLGAPVIDALLNLLPGSYSMQIAMNDGTAAGSGVVVVGSASVPEPSTLISLSVGLLCVSAAGARSRRGRLAAA